MGQHDELKKYWQSSQCVETLQVVISEDEGRITIAISMKLAFNLVEPLWYGRSWPRSQSERGKSNLE